MKRNSKHSPTSFPRSYIDYQEVKYTIDGNDVSEIVPIEIDTVEQSQKLLPADAYPNLENQLKAGIMPEFVDPRLPMAIDLALVEEQNLAKVQELYNQHEDLIKPQPETPNESSNE